MIVTPKGTAAEITMRPHHDWFMDEDMRSFWRGLKGPLPGDLRLYGGTALALYLDHRHSTDFDFVSPQPVVDLAFARGLPWLEGCQLNGGPGMIDARLQGQGRQILVTLMETGPMVPVPTRPPVPATNGVAVAHPFDLIVAKLFACLSREAPRDFVDLAAAADAWPETVLEAMASTVALPAFRLAARLSDPPIEAVAALGPEQLDLLRGLAAGFARPSPSSDGFSDADQP